MWRQAEHVDPWPSCLLWESTARKWLPCTHIRGTYMAVGPQARSWYKRERCGSRSTSCAAGVPCQWLEWPIVAYLTIKGGARVERRLPTRDEVLSYLQDRR